MKKEFLGCVLLVILLLLPSSCKFSIPNLKEIKFKPDMQLVVNKYKAELKTEIFTINPGWTKIDTLVTNRVLVSIINANHLPDSDTELKILAKKIAVDIYNQIENKSDFSLIQIMFENIKGITIANFQTKKSFVFKSTELE